MLGAVNGGDPVEFNHVVGVMVVNEAHQNDRSRDSCFGVLVLKDHKSAPLGVIRREISNQLHCPPTSFSFLTSQGWPISLEQENLLNLRQITSPDGNYVCIRRYYGGKPRIGIIGDEGHPLGFVFVDVNGHLNDLRDVINGQLENLMDYSFIDRNNWPIAPSQEHYLLIMDLIKDSMIRVRLSGSSLPSLMDGSQRICRKAELQTEFRKAISNLRSSDHGQMVRPLSFHSSIDEDRPASILKPKCRQILISYVRAEAADHAVRLKASLTRLGYSVYLDVHEIKSGVDWQDALNNAVSSCEVFVPLVTPRYGETQWTNREVKLADVLLKFILPISFLAYWPPKCLAIQFATTQYIPWKIEENSKEDQEDSFISNHNIRIWAEEHINNVAKEIVERLKAGPGSDADMTSHGQLMRRLSTLKSYPAPLANELDQLCQHRDGRPLVVISLHPAQNDFGMHLNKILEADGYEVWLSTQVLNWPENLSSIQSSHTSLKKFQTVCLSNSQAATLDLSSFSQQPEDVYGERLRRFQEKADEAGIIIWVLSKEFAESKMTREQVFYCEQRKRMIAVLFEDIQMPCWMAMLIGTQAFEDARNSTFEDSLKTRINKAFRTLPMDDVKENELSEEKLTSEVQALKQKITTIKQMMTDDSQRYGDISPDEYHGRTIFVYVSGSVKFYSGNTEAVCKSIGVHLAHLDGVRLVTGGFYGVGETVGMSYHSEFQKDGRSSNVWHILPSKDSQDQTRKGRQNADKTFQAVPYGRTIFSGNSVRERETIVSRAFDLCILIEGGPCSAYEAEQFIWNDHVVVPVRSTGGAAGGLFNIPERIFAVPAGVSKDDWKALEDVTLSADHVGKAVANIVSRVRDRLALDSPNFDLEKALPYLKSESFTTSDAKMTELSARDDIKSPKKKRLKWLSTDGDAVEFSD